MVTVAHPDRRLLAGIEAAEELPVAQRDERPAVLTPVGSHHAPTAQMREELHAVADAEHRNAGVEEPRVGGGHASPYTELGPPERMMPFGLHSRIHSSVRVGGWISQ
jgi:hypothetical protein